VKNTKRLSYNIRLREDKKDVAVIEKRKSEPSRPFREYLADKSKKINK
jgi:hypothetical protein